MTGKRIQFFATASALLLAGSAMASNERVREGASTPTASAAPRTVQATATPKSFMEYAEALKAGLISGPPAPKASLRSSGPSARVTRYKGSEDIPPIPTLPCGTYDDSLQYDTDHGPFLVNDNSEDFDTAPGLADDVGSPGYCAFDDGSNNPDLDCQATADTAGWTTCTGSEAGDIGESPGDGGLGLDNGPSDRGSTWWEMLATQPGFLGFPNIAVLPNYFGDTHDVTFPLVGDANGCGDSENKPNTWAATLHSPFGTDDATLTVHLTDGTDVTFQTGPLDVAGDFFGICCTSTIDSIQIQDTGSGGTSVGLDNIKWKNSAGTCEPDQAPVTLELIYEALEVLELKLDSIGTGTGGGGSSSGQ